MSSDRGAISKGSRRTARAASAVASLVVLVSIAIGTALAGCRRTQVETAANGDDGAPATDVPVRAAALVRTTLHRYVEGFGTVIAEPAADGKPAASARLASPVSGVLARAFCTEGQHVEAGAKLFELDARAATAEEQKALAARSTAEASVEKLRAALRFQQRELERTRELHDGGLASDKALHQAELDVESARTDLEQAKARIGEAEKNVAGAITQRTLMIIKSPIPGTVVKIFVNPGEAIDTNPATTIAEVVDLDRLVVEATLPAATLPLLAVGQAAELRPSVDGAPGDAVDATIHASIAFIGYQVDTRTDSIPIRIAFPRDAHLRLGQSLRVRIVVGEHRAVLAAPDAAVVKDESGQSVVATVTGDTATQRPVSVGYREGGLVEVSGDGLAEGTRVVTLGAYGLPKVTKVRITEEPGAAGAKP